MGPIEVLGEFDRDLAAQASPSYQAGRVVSHSPPVASFWARDPRDLGAAVEKNLNAPGAVQSQVLGVAAGFDGRLAAAVGGIDAQGRAASAIVWMNARGDEIRTVRTSPFTPARLAFTADGTLWAAGVVKQSNDPLLREAPIHDVLRRYDADGRLIETLVPRRNLADGPRHPVLDAVFVGSREAVALVAPDAGRWVVLAADGGVIDQGPLRSPEGFRPVAGALTDDGRLFLHGQWKRDSASGGARTALFEVRRSTGEFTPIDLDAAFGEDSPRCYLIGSEGDDLAFLERRNAVTNRVLRVAAP